MMAGSGTQQARAPGSPEWIFPWRDPARSPWPKLFATAIVAAAFALLFAGVRVRVEQSPRGAARKASVMYLPAGSEGRAWSLRAREDGPFPSRFDPATWRNSAGIEREALDAARVTLPPHVPVLRDLPAGNPDVGMRVPGADERFFPKWRMPAPPVASAAEMKLAPVLYPLSGIAAAEMPAELPPFTGPLDAAATAVPWRTFLLRLRPGGEVAECVSLAGGEAIATPLEHWLRGVKFRTAAEWISVAVAFTNRSADGPDAR